MVLPDALTPDEVAACNAALDPIEQIGLRCRDAYPDAPGVRPEDKYERLGALWVDEGEGLEAKINIGNAGQKIWSHGITTFEPALAAVVRSRPPAWRAPAATPPCLPHASRTVLLKHARCACRSRRCPACAPTSRSSARSPTPA